MMTCLGPSSYSFISFSPWLPLLGFISSLVLPFPVYISDTRERKTASGICQFPFLKLSNLTRKVPHLLHLPLENPQESSLPSQLGSRAHPEPNNANAKAEQHLIGWAQVTHSPPAARAVGNVIREERNSTADQGSGKNTRGSSAFLHIPANCISYLFPVLFVSCPCCHVATLGRGGEVGRRMALSYPSGVMEI